MTESITITLALEYNHNPKEDSLGSVWAFWGDGRQDLALDRELEQSPGWTRIIGPVDYDLASQVHESLKALFQTNGVSVIDEGISD